MYVSLCNAVGLNVQLSYMSCSDSTMLSLTVNKCIHVVHNDDNFRLCICADLRSDHRTTIRMLLHDMYVVVHLSRSERNERLFIIND